jgi:anaerobic selenocysteine-containing dehydrogenase
MTATAVLSHYIIPPKLLYERVDVAKPAGFEGFLAGPAFNQYLPAVVGLPQDSELVDDWYPFWALAKRLNVQLSFAGQPLDLTGAVPSTDELLDILFRDSRIPLDTLRQHPRGKIFDEDAFFVSERDPASTNRFDIAPDDVVAELLEVLTERPRTSAKYPFLLTVRRIRSTHNSLGRNFGATRKRGTFNPVYVHPDDLCSLDLDDGEQIELASEVASVSAIVSADATMQRGVVSMTHCWGMLPEDDYETMGVSTSQLVRTDIGVEPINAMPAMSAIPVRLVGKVRLATE